MAGRWTKVCGMPGRRARRTRSRSLPRSVRLWPRRLRWTSDRQLGGAMEAHVVLPTVMRLAVWGVLAFWLWLSLFALLRALRIPLANAVAAALSWVGVGLSLPWLLRFLASWGGLWLHLSRIKESVMFRLFGLVIGVVALSTGVTFAVDAVPRHGGELLFVVPSEPPSYDAHREETFGLIHPTAPHYDTLLRVDPFDPTGTKVVPSLAESWTISKDGRTYTLKLHQGVRFHDGSVMTSQDVKASYDRIILPPAGVASSRKGSYEVVEAVEAPEPYTVRFHLKWPSASFLSGLASPWNWIYKADILAKDQHWYETQVMGTGPFVF